MTNEAGTDKSGIDDTVLALGELSKALETIERARGRLYDFHQMSGEADHQVGVAKESLRQAGHGELADELRADPGRAQRPARPLDVPDRR